MFRPFAIVAISLATLAALPADAARRRAVTPTDPLFNPASTQGGYADRVSVPQGGNISFHIATSIDPFTMTIVDLNDRENPLMTLRNRRSSAQNCSGEFTSGCGWNATATIEIPGSWPSGYYAAVFPTAFGTRYAPFVVRAAQPGSRSKTLVVSATNTHQASNRFGGASLYYSDLGDESRRGSAVSFLRPFGFNDGLGEVADFELPFAKWLAGENRRVEVATDLDLEDPSLLSHYNLVVFVGRSEYWTTNARRNLESFIASGGHAAILGGSTMWWQVRLEDQNRTLVAYKENARYDPLAGNQPSLTTTHWFSDPIFNPENSVTGTSFRHGGYANRVEDPDSYDLLPLGQRTGFTVTAPSHWAYTGVAVAYGTTFGRESAGLEVDGTLFDCAATGLISGAAGGDGTPANFQILATTPSSDGYGTVGIYTHPSGGTVFNAASTNWVLGLASNSIVRGLTGNVLDRLGTGAPQSYDPSQSAFLTRDSFNCPQRAKLELPGWNATDKRADVTSRCAYEGPAGMELSGEQPIELSRAFVVSQTGRSDAELRFYIKLDDFQQRTSDPLSLITLRAPDHSAAPVLVEIHRENNANRIRVARRATGGQFFASPFTTLSNGWHLVELTYRSPGTISLRIDGGTALTLQNPESGRTVGEVAIDYPFPEVSSAGRVCIDALAVGTQPLGGVIATKY